MTVLRKILKKSAFMAALATTFAAVLLTVSCSGLVDVDNKSDGKNANVKIFVGDIDARDAFPDFEPDEFSTYKLTYKSGSVSKSKQWTSNAETNQNAYQMMNNEVFSIPLGTYTFILTANDVYGTIYKGTIENRVITANTSLSFSLKYNRSSEDVSGNLTLNVSYPKDNVTKLVASAYASTDIETYASAAKTALSTYTGSNITGTYTLSSKSMTPGAYIVEFLFYGGANQDILIGKWLRYAYIAGKKTSSDTFDIDSLDDVYTITYPAEATVTGAKTISFTPRMDVTLPASDTVTRTGYTFDGWYLSADEDGTPTGEPVTGWTKGTKTDSVTLYAKWIPNTYTVNYYTELQADGELSDTPFAVQTSAHGATLTAPETNPSRTGYNFAHWTDSVAGTAFDFENTEVTGNTNLYAVWSYDVAFNKNADAATGEMEDETFLTSWLGTEAKALTANAYELEGYSFLGWADADDADDADYADGETVSFTAAKTLYAVWHDNSTGFVIVFDANGGTAVAAQTVQDGETASEPSGCTKDDYALTGWYTDSSLTAVYDFTMPVTASIKLYAKWVNNTYYVSASGNDTSGNGTRNAPFATLSKAVNVINSTGSNDAGYEIVVSGTIATNLSITSTSLSASKAKSLTIRGAEGNSTDKLSGNSNSDSVLTLNTTVPIILKDITITNGHTTQDAKGAGINISTGSLTMDSGTLITGNTSTRSDYGAGMAIRITGGTVTMRDGAVISNNNANGYAYYSAGVCVSSGTFNMEGGIIKDNNCAGKNGGAVYVDASGTFTMSGGAYIPYGGASGKNDVFLGSGKTVTVKSTLTGRRPAASITCASYSAGKVVVTASDDVTLSDEAPKFAVTSKSYKVDGEGKLASRTAYTITYKDMNAAAFSGSTSGLPVSHGTGETTVLSDSVKEGYTFAGWYLTSSCTGDAVSQLTDENCTSSITLYAKWTEKPYFNVTYKDAGGTSYSGSNSGSLVSRHYMGDAETLVNAAKTNYVFDGWYTSDDDGVTLSDEPVTQLADENCTADLTLYAKWKPHYTITYMDEGGAAFTGSASSIYRNEGEQKTLPSATKTNAIFAGWFFSSECTGEPVTVLNDTNCTSDTTVYAKWIPYYTVTYKDRDSADFSGVYTNGTPRSTYYSGDSSTWNVPSATKEGSLFMGWFLESDCSGAKVTTLKNLSGNITLYAWWQVPNVTVTVGSGDISITKTEDDDTITLTAADGYRNYSWLIKEGDDVVDATTIINGSTVSEDGKTFTVNKETMAQGHVYIVRVAAQNKYGTPYSTNITIKK